MCAEKQAVHYAKCTLSYPGLTQTRNVWANVRVKLNEVHSAVIELLPADEQTDLAKHSQPFFVNPLKMSQ
jgi:hypothetical protein